MRPPRSTPHDAGSTHATRRCGGSVELEALVGVLARGSADECKPRCANPCIRCDIIIRLTGPEAKQKRWRRRSFDAVSGAGVIRSASCSSRACRRGKARWASGRSMGGRARTSGKQAAYLGPGLGSLLNTALPGFTCGRLCPVDFATPSLRGHSGLHDLRSMGAQTGQRCSIVERATHCTVHTVQSRLLEATCFR